VYIEDTQTIARYSANLNFVESIYTTTGGTVQTDDYDVVDFVSLNLIPGELDETLDISNYIDLLDERTTNIDSLDER
jgi:hypothetical protein